MSFIETMPEDDIIKLAERLQQYIMPKSEQKEVKKINDTYTVKQVSKITGKHRHTIRSHIKIGLLEAKKTGKSFIITQENLTKYIQNDK